MDNENVGLGLNTDALAFTVNDDSTFEDFVSGIIAEIDEDEKSRSVSFDVDFDTPAPSAEREEHKETVSEYDALWQCMNDKGNVDIEYISKLTAKPMTEVIVALRGSIYQNPLHWHEVFYKGFEVKDEYLSGNVFEKLLDAKRANMQYDGKFQENIEALSAVLPTAPVAQTIHFSLGSHIITPEYIDMFIKDIFGCATVKTKYNRAFNKYRIFGMEYPYMAPAYYCTPSIGLQVILQKMLNNETLELSDYDFHTKKSEVNKYRTEELKERVRRIDLAFSHWLRHNATIEEKLLKDYYRRYMCIIPRRYDGSYLTLPGKNEGIKLKQYQLNAVARIIATPNVLLAHTVGTGKTYIMVASCMELKRLGLAKKSMFVVPNHLTAQWKEEFLQLYPNAKLITVTPKSFSPQKRERVLRDLRDNDYDGIIIAYTSFLAIPLSVDYLNEKWNEERESVEKQAQEYWVKKEAEAAKKRLIGKLERAKAKKQEHICFDDLNVSQLYVDEAHNFKNLYIDTKIENIRGFNNTNSQKCSDLFEKLRQVQESGRGAVFATGTPICNNLSDVYIMQRYLQYDYLRLLELDNFDRWVALYAQLENSVEIDVIGDSYRTVKRFSKFNNLPELSNIVAIFADVFMPTDNTAEIERVDKLTEQIPRHSELASYIQKLTERADAVHSRKPEAKNDNMLCITTDGRRAALDMRLVEASATDYALSKVNTCARTIRDIWLKYSSERKTQLVFCDQSTPKASFNVYDELKMKLIFFGIPENEIAFVHDACGEKETALLHAKVRSGEIRVLIGSTVKLGIGANVQERLVAIHHLDIPWRPADMVQREGRMVRQGNKNRSVAIYRYVVKGSFDAYSWQILENKQRFISQFLSGDFPKRESDALDEIVLSYAEVKALCVNNELIKEKIELENRLQRLGILKVQHNKNRLLLEDQIVTKPIELENADNTLKLIEEDWAYYSRLYLSDDKYELNRELTEAEYKTVALPGESEPLLTIAAKAEDAKTAESSTLQATDEAREKEAETEAQTNNELSAQATDGPTKGAEDGFSATDEEKPTILASGYDMARAETIIEAPTEVAVGAPKGGETEQTFYAAQAGEAYTQVSCVGGAFVRRESPTQHARRLLGERIFRAIEESYSYQTDKSLFSYCGFTIKIPARVQLVKAEKVIIYLERRSKYSVDVSGSAGSVMYKIDATLRGLERRIGDYRRKVYNLLQEIENVKAQLAQEFTYNSEMEDLAKQIEVLNGTLKNAT